MKAKFLLAGLVAASAILIPATTASAADTSDHCWTSTTTLTDRPDSGFVGGTWALDHLTRTTVICLVEPEAQSDDLKAMVTKSTPDTFVAPTWTYHATVTDGGTFDATKNPSTGGAIPPTHGTVKGHFTQDFTSKVLVGHFEIDGFIWDNIGRHQGGNGESFSGTDPSSTSDWVQYVFAGNGKDPDSFKSEGMNQDWTWTYQTKCGKEDQDQWIDAADNNAGDPAAPYNAGAITGAICPSPSGSPSGSPSVTPSTSGSTSSGGGSLPVTGFPTGPALIVGGVLLLLGVILAAVGYRRRHESDPETWENY